MRKIILILCLLNSVVSNAQETDETSVLFIGNSFTFFNNMPFMFQDLANSNGKRVVADTVVKQGQNLKYHTEHANTYAKINSRKWNVVVIQGHSDEFAQPESEINTHTIPYLKQLIDSVKKGSPCAKIVLYMTWGYKNGNASWKPISNYAGMQNLITKEYKKVGSEFHVIVAPVGEVWREVRKTNPKINLYVFDKHHPTVQGSYIAACTFYTAIFGSNPIGIKDNTKLSVKEKAAIQTATYKEAYQGAHNYYFQKDVVPNFELSLTNKTVNLKSTSLHANNYEWNISDGSQLTGAELEHHFTETGEYKIELTASTTCEVKKISKLIMVTEIKD